ncbi:hypothetical protein [Actinoalloteichus hymeniacidonis]|uniref:Uncharacterized protein n=1 Tax=Actinoalloteichus hymeniacidonis TaxID=340345 RepID=A0AAC9MY81_9PSEU|nr:hypothetical protein [Actinoalloteichus hymeniacidonis]AOS63030.1 hypothetical protein TL08_11080 [Actinoalloteichus hymeniacidonis]MBB5908935.1 flagellar hook-basal body complex protein FliE [Actinoalloteichus hymeniacidonis]
MQAVLFTVSDDIPGSVAVRRSDSGTIEVTVRRGQVITAEFAQVLSDAIASVTRPTTVVSETIEAVVETPSPRSAA